MENNKAYKFLRTFSGHNATALSYARFPYEQLDKFEKFLKKSENYNHVNGLDRCELTGLLCIRNGRNQYMALRRFNGEAFWNITNIASHVFRDFDNQEIINFLKEIDEKTSIDLKVPSHDYEYIEPSDQLTKEKYTNESCRGFGKTSNYHISKVEAREKRWLMEEK